MLDKIQLMTHTFRTAYGDSNLSHGRDTITEEFRHFIMGIFHVNGSASQIWLIISFVVFSVLRAQGFGINFVNYFTTEIAQVLGFSYVDE